MRFFGKRKEPPPSVPEAPLPPVSAGTRYAENLGDLWHRIEDVARQDGLSGRSAVEHFNLSAEGKKDVERWLNIYLRRINPAHSYRLPDHHPRHRGYCLVPRVWPDGLRWQAIHEETLFRAPIPEEPDPPSLRAALDRWLEGRPSGQSARP